MSPSNFRAHRVNIKQVAREAGVSTMTVSRVINQRPDVSPGTRELVLQVVDRLGYRPSSLARSLIQQRSYTLGVVTAGLAFAGPSLTLNGIANQAEKLGYALLLRELPGFDANDPQEHLNTLLSRHVDGIIWAVPEVEAGPSQVLKTLADLPIPVVCLTRQAQPGISVIAIDNLAGSRAAVQHLLDQGCRRIGHISGPLSWWEARERRLGWEQTLSAFGLPCEASLSIEGNWSSASGEKAAQLLLDRCPAMDAVFVANDQMALSLLLVAHRRGIRVPGDLAVVGFDDLPKSAFYDPPLSTVHQDLHVLGSAAVHRLVSSIDASFTGAGLPPSNSLLIQPQLILRDSSRR